MADEEEGKTREKNGVQAEVERAVTTTEPTAETVIGAVFSTVPSVRNFSGRDWTANRRPSEGRTETVPSF
jgi:hypothetical protein